MTALLAAALLVQVQVRDAPKDWKAIETPHFTVNYPDDALLPRAREFGGWFEEARASLVKWSGIEPPRIHVYLYRSFHDLLQSSFLGRVQPLSERLRRPSLDRPREHAFCRPNPRSRALALAEPTRDRIFIHCQASDRWNAWFIRHELAHHVQFEHLFALRMPSWLLALKDPIIPSWFWEGGADYLAGIFDSAKDQYVRDLANEGLYSLKDLHTPDILNRHDRLAVYYQGSYFWRFLDEKYGNGTAQRLFDRTDRGLPLASQKPLQAVVGKSRAEIEREFEEHLHRQWAPMMEGRGVPAERLTDVRAYYRRRAWGGRWSPDGTRLAWIGDEDVWPELYVDGRPLLGWRRGLTTGHVVSPPSWSPDGKRIAVIEGYVNRDNMLLVDIEGGVETVALDFDELYDPAWSPDDARIAFSALKDGTSDLYVLHLSDRRVERLTNDPEADSAPAWSPDGRLAWIKESEGRTVLHVSGKGAVTKSWALLERPQWSPDGKSIALAADVGGVWDAFAIDPETGRVKRLTRFKGGVSDPAWHPRDGSLVVTYYEGRGQDLHRVVPQPQDEPGFDEEGRRPWYDSFRKPAPAGEPAQKSRDWGVNWLMFPVTSGSLLMPGAELIVGDRDAENHLILAASALASDSWTAGATVTNTRWRPTLGVAALAGQSGDLREALIEPFVQVPFWGLVTTEVGWIARERREDVDGPDPQFFDSGPTASLLFSNLSSYQSRDPAWGSAFGVTASYFTEEYGGDRRRREFVAFSETAIDLAQDWIAWSRVDYWKHHSDVILVDELLELDDVMRGAEDELVGTQRGLASLELRFPIWRDLLWKPVELIGLGEWLVLKDLRGFVFGQAGSAGTRFDHLGDPAFSAVSAGIGLRLDFSWMAWPAVNGRVPTRFEAWWAVVGHDDDGPRGAVGFAVTLGL